MSRFKRKTPTKRFRRMDDNDNGDSNNNNGNHITKSLSIANNNGNGNNGQLTFNEQIFADEWLKHRNGTEAVRIAYPNIKNDNVAANRAWYLLRKPKIKTYIDVKLAELSASTRITQEWILKRYEKLVEWDPTDFFNNDGSLKPLDQIPKEKLYAICGMKHLKRTTRPRNKEEPYVEDFITNFKMPKKKEVLDSLAKWKRMFSDKPDGPHDDRPNVNYNIIIPESSDRASDVLGILLGSGYIQRRLIEHSQGKSRSDPEVIDAKTD